MLPLLSIVLLFFSRMKDCIVIVSDSEDEMKGDSPVIVFTPTKRPPSPDLIEEER